MGEVHEHNLLLLMSPASVAEQYKVIYVVQNYGIMQSPEKQTSRACIFFWHKETEPAFNSSFD